MSLQAVMKTGNGTGIHTEDGTEIGRDPESIGRGIVTVLRAESVTVTGIDVTEKGDIVTVTKEATARDERNDHRAKTETNPKSNEKRKDTARLRAPKLPVVGLKRENW